MNDRGKLQLELQKAEEEYKSINVEYKKIKELNSKAFYKVKELKRKIKEPSFEERRTMLEKEIEIEEKKLQEEEKKLQEEEKKLQEEEKKLQEEEKKRKKIDELRANLICTLNLEELLYDVFDKKIHTDNINDVVNYILEILNDRESFVVLVMYNTLYKNKTAKYNAINEIIYMARKRILQIKESALKKLTHPKIYPVLEELIYNK